MFQLIKLNYLFLLIFTFSIIDGKGQNTLAKPEVEKAVKRMSKLIADNYVFETKGNKIAQNLLTEYKRGALDNLNSWKAFDSIATIIIQKSSNDGHMYVRYDPKTVQELSAIKEEPENGNFSYDPFFYGNSAVEGNFGFREVKILDGNIGYISLWEINISEKSLPVLFAAMTFVSNTKALIIDVSNNGGGGSAIGNVFESFFLPKEIPLLEFKRRGFPSEVSKTVPWLTEKRYENPLFIIVNKNSFSAAEAFAFALQSTKRAKIVGQPSGGGAYRNSWYPVNEHIFISISTGAPTLPGTEISWQGKGVQPDYKVPVGEEIDFIKKLIK